MHVGVHLHTQLGIYNSILIFTFCLHRAWSSAKLELKAFSDFFCPALHASGLVYSPEYLEVFQSPYPPKHITFQLFSSCFSVCLLFVPTVISWSKWQQLIQLPLNVSEKTCPLRAIFIPWESSELGEIKASPLTKSKGHKTGQNPQLEFFENRSICFASARNLHKEHRLHLQDHSWAGKAGCVCVAGGEVN